MAARAKAVLARAVWRIPSGYALNLPGVVLLAQATQDSRCDNLRFTMADPKREQGQEQELLPLALAGIPKEDIDRQLDKLCLSEAFDKKSSEKKLLRYLVKESLTGNTQRLRVRAITDALFHGYDPGDSRARKEAAKLREHLDTYYASSEAERGEVRFVLPDRQYVIHAPPAPAASAEPEAPHAEARILEPAANAEVYQRVAVRGRIVGLDPDLRVWLVVRTPVGDHYPQCRVSRKSPEWENRVGIGLQKSGSDEGAVYEILLVAADADGDVAFYQAVRENRDGFGPLLPTDCEVLDERKVTRRDIRPGR